MFRYDEGVRGQQAPVRPAAGRGLAYWTDGTNERILYITRGYHLIQLDAKTGHLVPTFGNGGIVDLYDGLDQPRPSDGAITSNSPPIVVGDVVVVGAALRALAPSEKFLAGFIRGYDVRSGQRAWIFHTIPRTRRVWQRHLGERLVELHREYRSVGTDVRRPGVGVRVCAGRDAHE